MPHYKREQWVLASRIKGCPLEENFKISEDDVPELRKGEILCRALFISLDPITRSAINPSLERTVAKRSFEKIFFVEFSYILSEN